MARPRYPAPEPVPALSPAPAAFGSFAARTAPGAFASLAPGRLVDGKYAVERVLGEGGMGIVYLARDVHTDVHVVLKSIRAEFSHNQDFRERILAEGRVLARIDHPNVVRLNAVVEENGTLYLVMQYIEGESLDALIARRSAARAPIPFDEALRIFRQILLGVGAAHREGIIHRDIKPANILMRARDGVAKVTDFGIAKVEEDARAGRGKTQGIIGSLFYMAPEQLRGQRDLDKRADIYALGILLFELLAGHVPFDAPSDYELMRLHLEAPVPKIATVRPDVAPWVDEVLARACAKDRAARFATAEEFSAALSSSRSPWPRLLAMAATGLVLVAAGGAAALVVGGRRGAGLGTHSDTRAPEGGTSSSITAESSAGGSSSALPISATASAAAASARINPHTGGIPSGLKALVGRWKSDTNRDYDAVLSGNVLEFRIVHASQYPRQGYHDGEERFTLTALRGQPRAFGVEDHIRPIPPKGVEYDESRARASCQEVWSSIGKEPLRAEFDGARLTVDLVKLEARSDRFQVEGDKVVACRGLRDGATSKIESMLVRAGP